MTGRAIDPAMCEGAGSHGGNGLTTRKKSRNRPPMIQLHQICKCYRYCVLEPCIPPGTLDTGLVNRLVKPHIAFFMDQGDGSRAA